MTAVWPDRGIAVAKGRDLELVKGEAVCNWIGWPLPAGGER